ncbi:MAG: class I SAM-dependent methyltransferase [Desulfovibrio sp.]|nr:class I SAM-dependent methyltransferase [Desulfovibrio sp.]MBI4961271.1 class I SAM-dependent methyltransferase [Desulfovibrio sp.]
MSDPRSAFFDERAAGWESLCYPDKVRARLWPLVQSLGLPWGGTVLDMGSGPGTLLHYERRAIGPEGTLFSFDVSFEMMRQAMAKDPGGAMCRMQATAMLLPLKDASFDALVCFAAFPHFSDKPAAMAEMARVSKRGGKLFIAHLLSRAELMSHHKTHPAVADDHLPDTPAMRRLFMEAGFEDPVIIDEPGRYLATARKP